MICIGCGCDEQHACTLPGGEACAWIHAGARGLAGICSACIEMFPPSIIERELATCEAAIAEAEQLGVPTDAVEAGFYSTADALDDPREGHPLFSFEEAQRERSPLILPGDEEFHL